MKNNYTLFGFLSAALYFPIAPFLAKFGLGVCPILNEKGFWFGCQLNVKFVLSLALVTLFLGTFLQLGQVRKMTFGFLKGYGIPVTMILFQATSLGALIFTKVKLQNLIANTSEMAFAVADILLMVGVAAIGFQTLLLEMILTSKNRAEFSTTNGSVPASLLCETITLAQQILTPLFVLGMFFRLSLKLSTMEVDGWDTYSDILQKLGSAGIFILFWYGIINILAILGRWKLVSELSAQAESLVEENPKPIATLEKLGWLEPIGIALNKSTSVLEQKRKISSGFAKFVSNRMLEELVKSNESKLFGHQVFCGIIMSDLRNFTQLSNHLQPTQVVQLLNTYFEDMIEVLTQNSIIVDKFIGDGLLAYLPCEANCDPQKIALMLLKASHDMIERLAKTNEKLTNDGLPSLNVGIGLHLGDVVLGAIGSSQKMQYTIIGDSVNKTARLESLCKEFHTQCVLSKELVNQLPLNLRSELKGPILVSVKGFDIPMEIYTFPTFLKLAQNVA